MAEGNGYIVGLAVSVSVPGAIRRWLSARWATGAEEDFAVMVTETKAGQDATDQLVALPASPVMPPLPYFALVHSVKEFPAFSGLQQPFDFGRTGQCLLQCPLGNDTGMNHQYLVPGRPMG